MTGISFQLTHMYVHVLFEPLTVSNIKGLKLSFFFFFVSPGLNK